MESSYIVHIMKSISIRQLLRNHTQYFPVRKEYIITANNKPIARLVPYKKPKYKPRYIDKKFLDSIGVPGPKDASKRIDEIAYGGY